MSEQQGFLNRPTDYYICHDEFGYMLWSELWELHKKLQGTRLHFSLTADVMTGKVKEVTQEEFEENEKDCKADDERDARGFED